MKKKKQNRFCMCQNKGPDQLTSTFVLATCIVRFLLYLNPNSQVSRVAFYDCKDCFESHLVEKLKYRFSHVAAPPLIGKNGLCCIFNFSDFTIQLNFAVLQKLAM